MLTSSVAEPPPINGNRTNPRARVLLPVAGFFAGSVFLFLVGWTASQAVLITGLLCRYA
ncbi:MAG: hypothetical protein U0Y68_18570 [Blastocatellia bacterium]